MNIYVYILTSPFATERWWHSVERARPEICRDSSSAQVRTRSTAPWTGEGPEISFCIKPFHSKVISGSQDLRQASAPVAGLEPTTEESCRFQGRLANHCANDAPLHVNKTRGEDNANIVQGSGETRPGTPIFSGSHTQAYRQSLHDAPIVNVPTDQYVYTRGSSEFSHFEGRSTDWGHR
ncbi:hypothetical protein PoB_003260600 [Plakobranchus ocellatus]|uniref:Uncharacterized protein n=1 Tax=Plakobranchus ocellatus TaxID=259542 RepID=A0AAV4A4C9_9GAST|nr:hypothetical protein PoB_003260600 [Plakobranchus ocellatus]